MKKEKELYKKHRPKKLKDVVGQKAAVRKLRTYIKRDSGLPHVLLLTGPSGCGKTTIARIIKRMIKCGPADFTETNGASFNGVKEARAIEQSMYGSPIDGDSRLWLIDECHRITDPAWDILLKPLEDTPDHVYFIFCTTEPHKVKKTIQTRCNEITLQGIKEKDLIAVLEDVAKKEKVKLDKAVQDKIIEISEGSARQALTLLDGVYKIKDPDEQLEVLETKNIRAQSESVVKLLIGKGKPEQIWGKLQPVLMGMVERKEDPETVRRMILGYCTVVGLRNRKMTNKCFLVYEHFSDNFFSCGMSGLVFGCYEMLFGADDGD